jgi:hypothetical protein
MHILRKVGLGILSPLFIFLLFATAFDIGFIRTATHPATVKKLVAESGVYNSVVPDLLKQSGSITTPLGDISAADPAVLQAAQQVVSPQNVQHQTETAIDSIYQWLDGRIAQPQFTIGLAGNNGAFADSVSVVIGQRLAGLAACSASQSLAIARAGNFDAIDTTCLPRGVTAAQLAAQVKSSIAANQDFISQASISTANIKSGDNGQPLFEQPGVKSAPKQYQRAKKTPLILSVLTILIGAGIVFLSSSWQKGLRHTGINLVIIGLIMLIFSWGLNRAVSTKVVPKISLDNAVLQQDIRNLVTDIARQIDKNYWFFGGLYTVLGAGGITTAEVFRRRVPAATTGMAAQPARPSKI